MVKAAGNGTARLRVHVENNPKAAAILRESISRRFQDPLATSLVGPQAAQRAALCLALITGFQFMHRVIGLAALTETNSERLARRLEALFQLLISPTEIKRTSGRTKSIKHRA